MATVNTSNGPAYDLPLPAGTLAGGGSYSIAANGGKDIGPFTATISFPANFTVNGWDSLNNIDRSAPLSITRTGGQQQVPSSRRPPW